jgi:hypothetical protein
MVPLTLTVAQKPTYVTADPTDDLGGHVERSFTDIKKAHPSGCAFRFSFIPLQVQDFLLNLVLQ